MEGLTAILVATNRIDTIYKFHPQLVLRLHITGAFFFLILLQSTTLLAILYVVSKVLPSEPSILPV